MELLLSVFCPRRFPFKSDIKLTLYLEFIIKGSLKVEAALEILSGVGGSLAHQASFYQIEDYLSKVLAAPYSPEFQDRPGHVAKLL